MSCTRLTPPDSQEWPSSGTPGGKVGAAGWLWTGIHKSATALNSLRCCRSEPGCEIASGQASRPRLSSMLSPAGPLTRPGLSLETLAGGPLASLRGPGAWPSAPAGIPRSAPPAGPRGRSGRTRAYRARDGPSHGPTPGGASAAPAGRRAQGGSGHGAGQAPLQPRWAACTGGGGGEVAAARGLVAPQMLQEGVHRRTVLRGRGACGPGHRCGRF